MLETVPDDRNHLTYKLMVARLYNANVKVSVLQEVFGFDRKTMKKWGEALKRGDIQELTRVLEGRSARRKLTPELQSYIRMRFPAIYRETKYEYSWRMREEIRQVFGVTLSGESLRPLLKEWIEKENRMKKPKREIGCDSRESTPMPEPEESQLNQEVASKTEPDEMAGELDNRKAIPVFDVPAGEWQMCHHVGVLLFCHVFNRLDAWVEEGGIWLKQWLAALLLGAVNIEQTKLLDFGELKRFFGQCMRSLHQQRLQLGKLAEMDTVDRVLRFNALEVGAVSQQDFYYDPHTKQYTGMEKMLKGWCPSIRSVDKVLHMDCIHTAQGQPVYMMPTDNYEDLRIRCLHTVRKFRALLELEESQVITVVVDRGIFSHKVFDQVIQDPGVHLVTWEKGYKAGEWKDDSTPQSFRLHRSRNRAEDILTYCFDYVEEKWKADDRMRRLRVRAANPKGRTVEVGILTDDWTRPAPDLIELMFRRWTQENDFKYLDKHFGINEITSYAVTPYKELEAHLEDHQMKSGEYKALQMEQKLAKEKLGKLLVQEHQHSGKNPQRTEAIQTLSHRLDELKVQLQQTDKEMSRLQFVLDEEFVRLNTRNKYLMDSLKFLARNSFYTLLQPFKQAYDNYRDDHVFFRALTQSDGVIRMEENEVEVVLLPKPLYQPKVRRIIDSWLEELNHTHPLMPDGSNRPLRFRLGKKEEFELAIANTAKSPF